MKAHLSFTLIFFIFVSVITAQEPIKPILQPGDVEHFIKTFPTLKEDLRIQDDPRHGTMTVADAIKLKNESIDILKKHGWGEEFYEKSEIILLGYSYIVYGEEKKKADSALEKSLEEINSNPHLSDAMKKQLIEQMKTVKGVLKTQNSTFKDRMHKADMELIKPHIEELKEILDYDNESESNNSLDPTSSDSPIADEQASSELANQINTLLKNELETEFGPLNSEILQDSREIYGRVISIDYGLKQGNLDGSWGKKVMAAMGRLGITVVIEGNEVIAKDQKIASKNFRRLQFTTGDSNLIAATFNFQNE